MLLAAAMVVVTAGIAVFIDKSFRQLATANTGKSLYDFTLKNIKGQEWNLGEQTGKVIPI
jgi:hypothetical protein